MELNMTHHSYLSLMTAVTDQTVVFEATKEDDIDTIFADFDFLFTDPNDYLDFVHSYKDLIKKLSYHQKECKAVEKVCTTSHTIFLHKIHNSHRQQMAEEISYYTFLRTVGKLWRKTRKEQENKNHALLKAC